MRTFAEKLAGQAAVVQVNTQDSPRLAERFGVRGISALALLQQVCIVDQLPGALVLDAVLAWFNRKN